MLNSPNKLVDKMENVFMEKAREWVGLSGDADSFPIHVAKIYGHVENYLMNLKGDEDKTQVARNVAEIVKRHAPRYLSNCPVGYSHCAEDSFQILLDKLQD